MRQKALFIFFIFLRGVVCGGGLSLLYWVVASFEASSSNIIYGLQKLKRKGTKVVVKGIQQKQEGNAFLPDGPD